MSWMSWMLWALLAVVALSGTAAAAPKKARGGRLAVPPTASSAEVDKLKGTYKWGMTPDEVMTQVIGRVEASYDERLQQTVNDPTRQDRVRKEMRAEADRVRRTALIKFEGQKSGYDVSIIDQEFGHEIGESMLVAKEETSTRYFFFAHDRLYKMFIAFDKEMLQGKSFLEFGKMMQARFGRARDVYVEEKSKSGVKKQLDHFIWSTKGGDILRQVDRSGFYGVYCLVIADGHVERGQAEARKAGVKGERKDGLVEAVTSGAAVERDPNDNVVDRITGRDVPKPGGEAPANVRVQP